MFITVHAASGLIIGQIITNPMLSFITGLASHFLLDIIPHGDQDLIEKNSTVTEKEKILLLKLGLTDAVIMMSLLSIFYLNYPLSWSIVTAVIGTLLPDFLSAVYLVTKFKQLKKIFEFQHRLHYILGNFTVNLKLGFIVQIIFLIGFIAWSFQLK